MSAHKRKRPIALVAACDCCTRPWVFSGRRYKLCERCFRQTAGKFLAEGVPVPAPPARVFPA